MGENMEANIDELKSKFEFYNFFNLDKNLSALMAKVVSKKEKDDYICKVLECEELEKSLGHEKMYSFYMICKSKYGKVLDEVKFNDEEELFDILNNYTIFYDECSNIVEIKKDHQKYYFIDIENIEKKFPYLQKTFYILNEWRYKNNLLSIDDNISKIKKL